MTRTLTDLWPLLQDIREKGFAARRKVHTNPPPVPQLIEEFGLTDSAQILGAMIYMLDNYDGAALSTEHYRIRNAYDNPAVIERQLAAMAADGLFDKNGETYILTEKGRRLYSRAREVLRPRWHVPLQAADALEQVNATMKRLADSTFAVSEPPKAWSVKMRSQRGMKMSPDVMPLERLDWHTFDLWAYRDDAHLAAWAQYPVSPFAWEGLTYLWNGQCSSAQSLAEYHQYREFTVEDWEKFIGELHTQGWVEQAEDGTCRLTAEGQRIRDEAERVTDEVFYAPWTVLDDAEAEAFRTALTAVRDDLARIASTEATTV
ncbi:MAG: hypothetical protein SF029_25670 [bacterium]|nr:hypothetical protein [bacterium]